MARSHTSPDRSAGTPTRRELGAFYTPEAIVDYMVRQLSVANLSGRLLEPSGGDGAFVRGLLKAGLHADQLTVWDINPAVRKPLNALDVSVTIGDTLARTPEAGMFHAAIGNPPFLNKQSEYIKGNRDWLKKKYREIGANDTYAMFTWLTAQHLAPGGQLVFLISDTFFSLGIHRKFRQWLLANMRIDSLTLLPKDTFPGAAVNTVILAATMGSASESHQIKVIDARAKGITKPTATSLVPQAEVLRTPGQVFLVNQQDRIDLALAATQPRLTSILDGGLGMFTRDNEKYLAVITDSGVPRAPVRKGHATIDASKVTGKTWQAYHKRGGDIRWHAPVEHALRWDKASRSHYTAPSSALAGIDVNGTPRQGIAVSGISTRLSARVATLGAMWESNKVFVLFPKHPTTYPTWFLLAILNSTRYAKLAALTNHTISLQIRDINALPLLPFTPKDIAELAHLGQQAHLKVTCGETPSSEETAINQIVNATWARIENPTP